MVVTNHRSLPSSTTFDMPKYNCCSSHSYRIAHRDDALAQPPRAMERARETLDTAHDIAKLLDTGLDRESLAVLIALIEHGINPEALAAVVRELRRESAALRAGAAA